MTVARRAGAILGALAVALGPIAAEAQTLAGGAPITRETAYARAFPDPSRAESATRVDLSASGESTRVLSLPKGKSAVVDLPVDARDVLVTNPAVADAMLRSSRRILVLGVASGQTDAVFFDGAGRRILTLDIRVDVDSGALGDTIARLIPGSRVRVESLNNSVVLTGEVANAAAADQAVRLAQSYVATPAQVVNMLSIAGKEQVMLKVQIIEVQRTVIKQLGFDINALVGQIGGDQFTLANAASFAVNGGLVGGLTGGYNLDTTKQPQLEIPCSDPRLTGCYSIIRGPQDAANWETATARDTVGSDNLNKANSVVKAFERVGLVRTLAEPNLTAISGESAKFLAGGEYPVPVGRDTSGNVTIEFKPFGVGLGFTPVVMSEGRISLKISTEVSELTTNGAFTLNSGTAGNTTIPALNVRRAETTVEMGSGGSMMIAGLLQDATRQNIDSLPGMTNLPVLGALFRSRDYIKGETELVVMVTPYIVNQNSPKNMQSPADGLRIAGDAETVLMGKLNKAYRAKPEAAKGRVYQGPYGYVVE